MIVDFHCHVGRDKSGMEDECLSFEDLARSMLKNGVTHCVVFPFSRPDEDLVEESIEILEESKKRDWIIPFLRVNPRTISPEKFEELLDMGFKGVKLHPYSQDFNPTHKEYFWIYEMCQRKGLPILFHANAISGSNSHPRLMLDVARIFPELKVIIAHFFGNFPYLVRDLEGLDNVYTDTSICSGTMKRKQMVRHWGVIDRLLYGSDIPYDSQGVALLKLRESGLTEEEINQICYLNAKKLLGL